MIVRAVFLLIVVELMGIHTIMASSLDIQENVKVINSQLESAKDPKIKAKLYCYRARNYTKSGEMEKAEDDYLAALNSSYEGWILSEFGYFMYKSGQYEKAYNISLRLLEDFTYLKDKASKLKKESKKRWEEEYLKNNPPNITIVTEPDPNRVTRHNLIKQQQAGKGVQQSGGKRPGKSSESTYKYWGSHPKTKNIPEPKQRSLDF